MRDFCFGLAMEWWRYSHNWWSKTNGIFQWGSKSMMVYHFGVICVLIICNCWLTFCPCSGNGPIPCHDRVSNQRVILGLAWQWNVGVIYIKQDGLVSSWHHKQQWNEFISWPNWSTNTEQLPKRKRFVYKKKSKECMWHWMWADYCYILHQYSNLLS